MLNKVKKILILNSNFKSYERESVLLGDQGEGFMDSVSIEWIPSLGKKHEIVLSVEQAMDKEVKGDS